MYFNYGEKEIKYLKSKDKKLDEVIERLGHLYRPVNHDIFSSIINYIIGQQISTKAQQTIYKRMAKELGVINTDTLLNAGKDKIQSFGLTYKKADYILNFCEKVKNKEIDLNSYSNKSDKEIIKELTSLKGIGTWAAEMVLLHCLERSNILSYKDLAIIRGMKIVYHHKKIDKKLFEKYRKRLSPYCSVASIYFWAVSSDKMNKIKGVKNMQYTSQYQSPLGKITIAANEKGLTGLWFVGQKYYARHLDQENIEKETEILKETKKWLDIYFSGREPQFKVPLHFIGTEFQKEVWEILCSIPYGQTMTYGDIANILAKQKNVSKISPQAVGGAVGHNNISIIVPCHRVVGSQGSLTGYAGGIDKKIALLKLEDVQTDHFYIPKKGTAL